MPGPEQSEVTVVQRCQLPFAQPLHNAQHRCIDEPDTRVRVLLADRSCTCIVLGYQVMNEIVASSDVPQELGQDLGPQAGGHEVGGFVQDGSSNDQLFLRSLQQIAGALMVRIAPVVRGKQWASVEDQRQGGISGSMSPSSRAVGPSLE